MIRTGFASALHLLNRLMLHYRQSINKSSFSILLNDIAFFHQAAIFVMLVCFCFPIQTVAEWCVECRVHPMNLSNSLSLVIVNVGCMLIDRLCCFNANCVEISVYMFFLERMKMDRILRPAQNLSPFFQTSVMRHLYNSFSLSFRRKLAT